MKYLNVVEGEFQSRPNRFIANILINKKSETVHVKNTGRCKELLIPGAKVYLSVCDHPNRKTKYDLIAVEKKVCNNPVLINMDSQIPNEVALEWLVRAKLFSEQASYRREVKFGDSRFDLFVSDGKRKAFIEVKGVTLEMNGVALFPDAPTQRGVKHLLELIKAYEEGYEAFLLFVIQMKGVREFHPNRKMHPEFAEALEKAASAGVRILAMDCLVSRDTIVADEEVPIII